MFQSLVNTRRLEVQDLLSRWTLVARVNQLRFDLGCWWWSQGVTQNIPISPTFSLGEKKLIFSRELDLGFGTQNLMPKTQIWIWDFVVKTQTQTWNSDIPGKYKVIFISFLRVGTGLA